MNKFDWTEYYILRLANLRYDTAILFKATRPSKTSRVSSLGVEWIIFLTLWIALIISIDQKAYRICLFFWLELNFAVFSLSINDFDQLHHTRQKIFLALWLRFTGRLQRMPRDKIKVEETQSSAHAHFSQTPTFQIYRLSPSQVSRGFLRVLPTSGM